MGRILQRPELAGGATVNGAEVIGADGNVAASQVFGKTWYVNGNFGIDTNDGRSQTAPFKTLAKAFAVSHADIATSPNWANRNRIYISGDSFTESLVAFPQKTDVIGVGSCDGIPTARIIGSHVPVNTAYGTRFYNIDFNATSGVIITETSATQAQYHDCIFSADGTATTGLLLTGGTDRQIKGCEFRGWDDANGFTTAAISLGTGASPRTIIEDCTITNSAKGILVHASRTGAGSRIKNCFINTSGITIDDAGSTFNVVENILVSAGNLGATSHVFAATKSARNYVTAADHVNNLIPAAT